jgi:hypothetical protein
MLKRRISVQVLSKWLRYERNPEIFRTWSINVISLHSCLCWRHISVTWIRDWFHFVSFWLYRDEGKENTHRTNSSHVVPLTTLLYPPLWSLISPIVHSAWLNFLRRFVAFVSTYISVWLTRKLKEIRKEYCQFLYSCYVGTQHILYATVIWTLAGRRSGAREERSVKGGRDGNRSTYCV